MTADDPNARPTLSERYGVAVSNGTGQEHMILAAGMQHERLGAVLLRLRSEYDAVRQQMERAGQIAPSAASRVRDLTREADQLKAMARRFEAANWAAASEALERAADLQREIAAMPKRTEAQIKTARAVTLMALTSLHQARQELGALAVRMGANPKREIEHAVALQLAGRVLDVWLDETCHKCDGTGRLGNRYAGDRERECPACKGSGHRRDILGDSLKQTLFARDVLAEVQRQVAAAAAGIKAAIHADSGPAKPMNPEFVRRLAELRGEQAAAD